MKQLIDDIVICVTVAMCLGIALFLAYLLVQRGYGYPPTLITLFLGIAVAALTYRFLGGTDGTTVSIGLLKVGGSAALLLGTTFIIGDRIRAELDIFENDDAYRARIDALEKESTVRLKRLGEKDGRIAELEQKMQELPAAQSLYNLERIKKLDPNDPLISGIRQLVEAQEGAFRQTVNDIEVRVALSAMPNDQPLYNICGDAADKLYGAATNRNPKILAFRSAGSDAVPVSIKLERKGRIGDDVCQKPGRDFDIQIGCLAALTLFPDMLKNCADGQTIRGRSMRIGSLPS